MKYWSTQSTVSRIIKVFLKLIDWFPWRNQLFSILWKVRQFDYLAMFTCNETKWSIKTNLYDLELNWNRNKITSVSQYHGMAIFESKFEM